MLNPKYHDVLAILKGARNGAVYGTKVRFPHALVYEPLLLLFVAPPDDMAEKCRVKWECIANETFVVA